MNSRFLIGQLVADGWYLVRVRGSHHHFKHPIKPGPAPEKDLLKKTAISILKQALAFTHSADSVQEDYEHALPDRNFNR
ncbi:type II toxin-antitoxin system HicA family toxin [Pseudomonas sp. MG-9]|nr:type II toxin-antitoxin system HicA family toxin [Pseudomonas sp. MG-9]